TPQSGRGRTQGGRWWLARGGGSPRAGLFRVEALQPGGRVLQPAASSPARLGRSPEHRSTRRAETGATVLEQPYGTGVVRWSGLRGAHDTARGRAETLASASSLPLRRSVRAPRTSGPRRR